MKCPHCHYKNGWGWWETGDGKHYCMLEGHRGDFYKLEHKFVRSKAPFVQEFVSVFACPLCQLTFVQEN